MKKPARSRTELCPITFALDVFGDKWSLLILRDIVFKGKKYYGDFLNSPEKISTNILASRLQKLDSEGLISKAIDPSNSSRNIYRLAERGEALLPVLLEIIEWSSTYNPQSKSTDSIIDGAPANLLRRSKKDRAGLIQEILERIK
ncbi:MAG: DNA-binding HxlR family transcriptional regulator [Gammaproteobacteria bacterium]|jgi:DNA-binding HxlR family transcriptional regulator